MSSATTPSQPPQEQDNAGSAAPSQADASATAAEQQTQGGEKHPLPLLPPAPSDGEATTLDVNGEGVRLDHLGPLVVHQDGTMSRISNWAEMSQIERDNTLRILGKRNQQRLKVLRGEDGKADGQGQGQQ